MDHKVLLANVSRLIKERGTSAHAVSKAAKRPDAIRNLQRRVRGEIDGSWNLDTLADIAEQLEVSPWELLRPPGAVPQDEHFRELVRDLVDEELTAREGAAAPQKRKRR